MLQGLGVLHGSGTFVTNFLDELCEMLPFLSARTAGLLEVIVNDCMNSVLSRRSSSAEEVAKLLSPSTCWRVSVMLCLDIMVSDY